MFERGIAARSVYKISEAIIVLWCIHRSQKLTVFNDVILDLCEIEMAKWQSAIAQRRCERRGAMSNALRLCLIIVYPVLSLCRWRCLLPVSWLNVSNRTRTDLACISLHPAIFHRSFCGYVLGNPFFSSSSFSDSLFTTTKRPATRSIYYVVFLAFITQEAPLQNDSPFRQSIAVTWPRQYSMAATHYFQTVGQ